MRENGSLSSAWPTPATRDHKGANGADHLENGTGRLHLDQLPNFVEHIWYQKTARLWTTPSAGDGQRGGTITDAMSGTSLTQQVNSLWATPSVADTTGGRMTRSGDRSNEPLLKGQSERLSSSLQDRIIYPVGQVSSHPHRSLNPLFVKWLMGWPPGWTLLAWTDFACSATELSRFRQRMRSALSAIDLPAEAPPAQLALFG